MWSQAHSRVVVLTVLNTVGLLVLTIGLVVLAVGLAALSICTVIWTNKQCRFRSQLIDTREASTGNPSPNPNPQGNAAGLGVQDYPPLALGSGLALHQP